MFFAPEAFLGWGDRPAIRHGLGANLSFVDGHAEHWRWPFKLGKAEDMEDLQRLWRHGPGL